LDMLVVEWVDPGYGQDVGEGEHDARIAVLCQWGCPFKLGDGGMPFTSGLLCCRAQKGRNHSSHVYSFELGSAAVICA
jgi:hypothetical protein